MEATMTCTALFRALAIAAVALVANNASADDSYWYRIDSRAANGYSGYVYSQAAYVYAWSGWVSMGTADAQDAAANAYASTCSAYAAYIGYTFTGSIFEIQEHWTLPDRSDLVVTEPVGYYNAYESQYAAYVSLYRASQATGDPALVAAYRLSFQALLSFYLTDSVQGYLSAISSN
jgi:hypothetical protein